MIITQPIPLASVAAAQVWLIVSIDAPPHDAARLMALGLCPGRKVEVVKQADPLIVRVVGTRIGISARLAATVSVRPPNDAAAVSSAG